MIVWERIEVLLVLYACCRCCLAVAAGHACRGIAAAVAAGACYCTLAVVVVVVAGLLHLACDCGMSVVYRVLSIQGPAIEGASMGWCDG